MSHLSKTIFLTERIDCPCLAFWWFEAFPSFAISVWQHWDFIEGMLSLWPKPRSEHTWEEQRCLQRWCWADHTEEDLCSCLRKVEHSRILSSPVVCRVKRERQETSNGFRIKPWLSWLLFDAKQVSEGILLLPLSFGNQDFLLHSRCRSRRERVQVTLHDQ